MSLPLYDQDPRNGPPRRGSVLPVLTLAIIGWVIVGFLYGFAVAPALDALLPLAQVLPR